MYTQAKENRTETDVLNQAIDAFARETGLHLRVDELEAWQG